MSSKSFLFSMFVMLVAIVATPQNMQASEELAEQSFVHKTVDGQDLSIDMIAPLGPMTGLQRPAVVFFHGGGWVGGKPGQFKSHSRYLAQKGIVCFMAQYRLLDRKSDDPPVICINDAKSAMRWVRSRAEKFGLDPNRIAAGGGSAGGHLAATVGMIEGIDDPKDDLSVSPKANALLLFNPVYNNGPDNGWGQKRVKEDYAKYSPAHNITADDPPAIVFLGSQDKLIPVSVAEDFQKQMQDLNLLSELHIYEGAGHGFFNTGRRSETGMSYYEDTIKKTEAFLKKVGWIE